MPKRKKNFTRYSCSIPDAKLVERFKNACAVRGRSQSWVVSKLMRYYVAHRHAFNGIETKQKGVKSKKEKSVQIEKKSPDVG